MEKTKQENVQHKKRERPKNMTHMVDRECRVEKAPGAMLEILLSYSDSRRTELKPVNVLLSMQLIWLLRSILETQIPNF